MDCNDIRKKIPGVSILLAPEELKKEVLEHIKTCPSCFLIVQKVYAWAMLVKGATRESSLGHLSEFDIACGMSCIECEDESMDRHLEDCPSCKGIRQKLEQQVGVFELEFMTQPERLLSVP